jgi:Tfp pilus assembly protein FimT
MFQTPKKSLKSAFGISMLEVLATVALSLIMGSLAVPKIIQTFQRYRLSVTARDMATTLQAARFVAILRQGIYGVQINNTTRTLEIVKWNGATWQGLTLGSGGNTSYDPASSRKQFNSNVTITTSGMGTPNVIAFNEKGELMNVLGTTPSLFTSGSTMPSITMATGAGTRVVTLTRFGNVRLIYQGTTNQM